MTANARLRLVRRGLPLAAAAALTLTLTACGTDDAEPEPATETNATSESSPEEATDTSAESSASTTASEEERELAKARERFSGLVPDELFDQFDSCTPNGLEDSVECSGGEVGQFQFFASESKAASTTQVLTELRSARVVEDKKDRVVGWSTLGNTAILTVVDNKRGLVVQQMASTDQIDPEDRIYELGLAEPPEDWTAPEHPDRSGDREPSESDRGEKRESGSDAESSDELSESATTTRG